MIGFAGLSHLGLVSSIAAASKGFEVTAYDSRRELCQALRARHLPILEPGLDELLSADGDRLRFTDAPADLGACDVVYVSLDVATDAENASDLSALRRLIDDVAAHLKPGAALVVLSQVPPGFTRELSVALDHRLRDRNATLYCQVETLVFGAAVERALRPERYIIGSADPGDVLQAAYAAFLSAFGCPVLQMRYESAELAKISINLFLAASVSATNTLAELCERVGADWAEIAPALRLDRRIGPHAYLAPGLGIGGGNIERDLVTLRMLAAQYATGDAVPSAFLAYSRYRRDWVIRMLHREVLARRPDAVIAVWGLAYKVNTKSTKNSPTLAMIDALPGVSIQLYDPMAILLGSFPTVHQVSTALDACRGAHALVIMTGWQEFAAVPLSAVHEALVDPVVIDPSGSWSDVAAADAGFTYATLGRRPDLHASAHAHSS